MAMKKSATRKPQQPQRPPLLSIFAIIPLFLPLLQLSNLRSKLERLVQEHSEQSLVGSLQKETSSPSYHVEQSPSFTFEMSSTDTHRRRVLSDEDNFNFLDQQHEQRRKLQDMLVAESKMWRIAGEDNGDPKFEYVDNQFIMTWEVSDYIADNLATFTVYDGYGCKEGDATDITEDLNTFYSSLGRSKPRHFGLFDEFRDSARSRLSTQSSVLGRWKTIHAVVLGCPANGSQFTRFSVSVGYLQLNEDCIVMPFRNPCILTRRHSSSSFSYTDDGGAQKARVDFCIRFSLYTDDHQSPEAVEVNFHETQVSFFADLTDGFEVGDVVVTSKDQNEEFARAECEIVAYECDRQNKRLANPGYLRNQGREVRVCVELSEESKQMGLLLDRIHWFYWILEHESGQVVRQNAIIFDSVESPQHSD